MVVVLKLGLNCRVIVVMVLMKFLICVFMILIGNCDGYLISDCLGGILGNWGGRFIKFVLVI